MSNKISGLYAITDPHLIQDEALESCIIALITGNTQVIQYRNKIASRQTQLVQASMIASLCQQHGVTFIVNDDPELAVLSGADGVHIGKSDETLKNARKIVGETKIIGVSCYNQFSNAQIAAENGADYIAFGRFFPSKTKPGAVQAEVDLIYQAKQYLPIPLVAIGGINLDNARKLISAGIDSIAVINALLTSDNISATASQFQNLFKS